MKPILEHFQLPSGLVPRRYCTLSWSYDWLCYAIPGNLQANNAIWAVGSLQEMRHGERYALCQEESLQKHMQQVRPLPL